MHLENESFKQCIIKNNTKDDLQCDITIDTQELLTRHVDKYGIRYVVRHFEIDKSLISIILDGTYNFTSDEDMTRSEIESFQSSILEKKMEIANKKQ